MAHHTYAVTARPGKAKSGSSTKRRLIFAVLMVAVVAGCGSATKTVTVRAPSTTTATSASTPAASTAPPTHTTATSASTGPAQCTSVLKKFDIAPTLCTTPNGAFNEVATANYAIEIPGMTVQFEGARTTNSVSDSSGVESARANGIFLIITLKVTNMGNTPQSVEQPGSGHFALSPIMSQAIYTESFQAENQADQQSFISQDTTPVQSGESQTGDIVFDVAPSALTLMRHDGAILEWGGFGQDLSSIELDRIVAYWLHGHLSPGPTELVAHGRIVQR